MAKIKHIAIISVDPDRLAVFYEEVFNLEVLHRADNGSVFMTDGYLNIALLTQKAEGKPKGPEWARNPTPAALQLQRD